MQTQIRHDLHCLLTECSIKIGGKKEKISSYGKGRHARIQEALSEGATLTTFLVDEGRQEPNTTV